MARRLAREAMSLLYQRIFSERYDIDELKGMVDNELN